MLDYRVDPETGALIFSPTVDTKIQELEDKIQKKDDLSKELLKRIEILEKKLEERGDDN